MVVAVAKAAVMKAAVMKAGMMEAGAKAAVVENVMEAVADPLIPRGIDGKEGGQTENEKRSAARAARKVI